MTTFMSALLLQRRLIRGTKNINDQHDDKGQATIFQHGKEMKWKKNNNNNNSKLQQNKTKCKLKQVLVVVGATGRE